MNAFVSVEGGSVKSIVWAKNPWTGEVRGLGVPHSLATMEAGLARVREGAYVQDAFPFLTPDEREFMISGFYGDEFDAMFSDDE